MKKIAFALLIGASMLATGAVAHAGNVELNMYGASAQVDYWNAVAADFLGPNGPLGCPAGPTTDSYTPTDPIYRGAKFGVIQSNGTCTGVGGTVTIRNVGYDSYQGYAAIQGIDNPNDPLHGAPTNCKNYNRTFMTASTGRTFGCYPVDVATADVAAQSLDQTGSGSHLDGPAGGPSFSGTITPPVLGSAYTTDTLVVVPFGFFLNNSVQQSVCNAASGSPYAGQGCASASDCGTATGHACNSGNVPSLSRTQIVNLFSGNVSNWNQLGKGFPDKNVTICLRVPGSGTEATMTYGVMKGNGWGALLPVAEDPSGPPIIYFNNTSTDLVNCVAGGITYYGGGTWSGDGAIGFVDADKVQSGMYGPVAYNGYYPNRVNIRNGAYDTFWAVEHIGWANTTHSGDKATLIDALRTYAKNPFKVPSAKAPYWATVGELWYTKDNDKAFPALTGASTFCQSGSNKGAVCGSDGDCTGGGAGSCDYMSP